MYLETAPRELLSEAKHMRRAFTHKRPNPSYHQRTLQIPRARALLLHALIRKVQRLEIDTCRRAGVLHLGDHAAYVIAYQSVHDRLVLLMLSGQSGRRLIFWL